MVFVTDYERESGVIGQLLFCTDGLFKAMNMDQERGRMFHSRVDVWQGTSDSLYNEVYWLYNINRCLVPLCAYFWLSFFFVEIHFLFTTPFCGVTSH